MLNQGSQHFWSAGGQLAVPEETRQEVLGSDEVSEQVGIFCTKCSEILLSQLCRIQSLSGDKSQ